MEVALEPQAEDRRAYSFAVSPVAYPEHYAPQKDFKMVNAQNVVAQINELEEIYLRTKSIFPALDKRIIGKTSFVTAPYYLWREYNVTVHTGTEITEEFVQKYSDIGKWINENAIIRLYGILNYHGLLGSIDQTLPGWKEVDLMRRMRNVFTKTQLNYKPDDPENIRLREEVISHFGLSHDDYPVAVIPTPVDTVVQPVFDACRNYVRGKCE